MANNVGDKGGSETESAKFRAQDESRRFKSKKLGEAEQKAPGWSKWETFWAIVADNEQ